MSLFTWHSTGPQRDTHSVFQWGWLDQVELCSSAALLPLLPQDTSTWINRKRSFKRLMSSCRDGECKGYLFLSKSVVLYWQARPIGEE